VQIKQEILRRTLADAIVRIVRCGYTFAAVLLLEFLISRISPSHREPHCKTAGGRKWTY